jgi:uncharacterized protein
MVDDHADMEVQLPVAQAIAPVRRSFLLHTYGHLVAAVVAFVALEVWYFRSGLADLLFDSVIADDLRFLLFLGGFFVVGWIARSVARAAYRRATEYVGLAAYVVAESLFFAPLLVVAEMYGPGTTQAAGFLTVVGFVGLSAVAFRSGSDFSTWRGLLQWGAVLAVLAIVGALLFGAALGTWFSLIMIGLAGAAILCDTSMVIHHYPQDKHVGAALELFASITLMLWYVLAYSSNE